MDSAKKAVIMVLRKDLSRVGLDQTRREVGRWKKEVGDL